MASYHPIERRSISRWISQQNQSYADSTIANAGGFNGNIVEGHFETASGKNKRSITVSGQPVGHQFFGTHPNDTAGGRIRGGIDNSPAHHFSAGRIVAKRWLSENPDKIIPAEMILLRYRKHSEQPQANLEQFADTP